jgi:uncharacterized protein (DUF1697 family)
VGLIALDREGVLLQVTRRFGFLRAINVGGRRIAMVELAAALKGAGLADVETFIASGNFTFTGAGDEATIEAALSERFGFTSEVFLRTRGELMALNVIVAPLAEIRGVHAVHVGFLRDEPDDHLRTKLGLMENDLDQFSFGSREIIWTALGRTIETPFGKKGMSGKGWPVSTFRNANTLGRKLEKWSH